MKAKKENWTQSYIKTYTTATCTRRQTPLCIVTEEFDEEKDKSFVSIGITKTEWEMIGKTMRWKQE